MLKNSTILVSAIYLSFSLDSLLKIGSTFKIHIGVLSALIFVFIVALAKPGFAAKGLLKNFTFSVFVFYCILNGVASQAPGFRDILPYILISTAILIYCHVTYSKVNTRAFYYFQAALILSGLIQYYLFFAHGYQVSFIDAEHYQKTSSVSSRLRGFFIEPNWFAIALAFNTLLLVKDRPIEFLKKHKAMSALTGLVIVLNGSIAPIALLCITYAVPFIKKSPVKGAIFSVLLLGILLAVFSYREQLSEQNNATTTLNHLSRWTPLMRVIGYQAETDLTTIVFGNGLGSWGTLAIQNRLSVLVYETAPESRDGSEIPVFIFELGLIGIFLILLDSFYMYQRCPKGQHYLKAGVLFFLAFLFLYPTLKFWMYMPYYFYLRAAIHAQRKPSRITH
ncbi:hypothetical protein [Pseudomonas abyssi]|uniref:O-antigen ligase-like membrane protein n=1 Tax=Pseudomonas abyssi TaxID=170540 RepID=A0A395R635_9PSED|nr:hypothetical protein [Halopseudomonas gallaeciensis]RGP55272.1 hypothetical protein ASB58_09405 [Halopseudomonas gallaeciensis]